MIKDRKDMTSSDEDQMSNTPIFYTIAALKIDEEFEKALDEVVKAWSTDSKALDSTTKPLIIRHI